MSVLNPIKKINKNVIKKNEIANVEISFNASPELKNKPSDIIIIFDKSNSMTGERLSIAKKGVRRLLDIIVDASGGIPNRKTGNGTRIALETFSSTAKIEVALTDNVLLFEQKLNRITASKKTNHSAAFILAKKLIDPKSTNNKIVVLFTDGDTTEGPNADPFAEDLKKLGVIIFCVGLIKDKTNLIKWASDPKEIHVVSTDDISKLENMFVLIAYEIIKVGAQNIYIKEIINNKFKIKSIDYISKGIANIVNSNTIDWNIDLIGITENEQAILKFTIECLANENNMVYVNDLLIYNDKDKNILRFPNPKIELIFSNIQEDIGDFNTSFCENIKYIVLEDTYIRDLGRVVEVDIPLKKICPNKKLSLGILLTEIGINDIEYIRGNKKIILNNKFSNKCEDILIKCIRFVVPEYKENTICSSKKYRVRLIINYLNTDYTCLELDNTIIS